jgi:hypothetical protein
MPMGWFDKKLEFIIVHEKEVQWDTTAMPHIIASIMS